MKKLSLFVLLVAIACVSGHAQLKFYYYPSTNVYYDVAQTQYIYQDNGNWIPVKVLPAKFKSVGSPRYVVYNKTPDVWVANNAHIVKYKVSKQKAYPHGKSVGYMGTNPNKAAGVGKVKIKVKH